MPGPLAPLGRQVFLMSCVAAPLASWLLAEKPAGEAASPGPNSSEPVGKDAPDEEGLQGHEEKSSWSPWSAWKRSRASPQLEGPPPQGGWGWWGGEGTGGGSWWHEGSA